MKIEVIKKTKQMLMKEHGDEMITVSMSVRTADNLAYLISEMSYKCEDAFWDADVADSEQKALHNLDVIEETLLAKIQEVFKEKDVVE